MKKTRILSLVILSVSFSACRFKTPTIAEQKYLMEKGAFPAGVPAWVATPTGGGRLGGGGVFSGGLIPQTFTPSTIDQSKGAIPSADLAGSNAGNFSTPHALRQAAAAAEQEPDSPLHRISKSCPSVESEVSATLTNLDTKQRIRSYESLTTRCPQSADIWLWLGKDYSKDGQLVKAGRAYERVLIIDASHKEAQELLEANRKELNAHAGKKPAEKALE